MAERSGEFSIIDRFFFSGSAAGPWFCKGIGDDCAIIDFGDSRIAVTIDMLAMGTHFLPDAECRLQNACRESFGSCGRRRDTPGLFPLYRSSR